MGVVYRTSVACMHVCVHIWECGLHQIAYTHRRLVRQLNRPWRAEASVLQVGLDREQHTVRRRQWQGHTMGVITGPVKHITSRLLLSMMPSAAPPGETPTCALRKATLATAAATCCTADGLDGMLLLLPVPAAAAAEVMMATSCSSHMLSYSPSLAKTTRSPASSGNCSSDGNSQAGHVSLSHVCTRTRLCVPVSCTAFAVSLHSPAADPLTW